MTVRELASHPDFSPIAMPNPDREVKGAYIGDLLSWVMGRAKADTLWLTIMSNVNVLAVASLADVSAVILTEGVTPESDIITAASEKGINLISTSLPSYGAARVLVALGL
ncbi:MAG: hypothetical protein IJW48_03775 [Clostridia bacterium]|nr:hypothetical protein [Clostridia bacterium]